MKRGIVVLAFLTSIVAYQGCGGPKLPPLGQVTGTVTLDGRPVAEARVAFEPTAKAAASSGLTDSSGKYTLYYTQDAKGAVVGKHVVRIDAAPADAAKLATAVQIPAKYNIQSTLAAEVKAGPNTIDFPLTSR